MAHKKKYTVHWKDFNSPLMRNEIWPRFCQLWHTEFGLPFVPIGIWSEKDAIKYFVNLKDVQNLQKILVSRVLENPGLIKKWIRQSDVLAKEMNRYTGTIREADLSRWSAAKLKTAYDRFAELDARQYAIGILLVGFDESFGPNGLDAMVRAIVARAVPKRDAARTFAVLTQPVRDSFSREQEKELLELYAQAVPSGQRGRVASGSFESFPRVQKLLKKHTKKWAWVYHSYAGPAWTERDFFGVMQDWARRSVRPQALLAEWKRERAATLANRKELLERMPLSAREKKIIVFGDIVLAKPRRKDYQAKSYWHLEPFFREVARRLGISLKHARSLEQKLLWKSLKKGSVTPRVVDDLYTCHVTFPTKNTVRVLSGKHAREFIKKNVREETHSIEGSEFYGTPACTGVAQGIVRVINSPDDMAKMNEGDILVSVATTPSIVAVMRKAAAILTDEGGLTCHAAIVSRELGIPCIVGFGSITSAVKDGDCVKVDAKKGTVMRLPVK